MCTKTCVLAAAAAMLLFPAGLFAGGPPWFSLPVDGVTSDNLKNCDDTLSAKLADKLIADGPYAGLRILQSGDQYYVTFYMNKDVSLREIEGALKGTDFSVPRDRLHVFGHAVLEIDAGGAPSKEVLAGLDAIDHVAIGDTESKGKQLLVTVDMPYPKVDQRGDAEALRCNVFTRSSFVSDPATRSDPAATPRTLPSYAAFSEATAKQSAKLKDVRWSIEHWCRRLGCVAVPDTDEVAASKRTKQPTPDS